MAPGIGLKSYQHSLQTSFARAMKVTHVTYGASVCTAAVDTLVRCDKTLVIKPKIRAPVNQIPCGRWIRRTRRGPGSCICGWV